MAKRVYFAFHYQDVIDFRANVVRKHNFAEGVKAAGYYDYSIWEDAKKTSPSALKKLIDAELENTSVTVVLIGSDTWARRWVRYRFSGKRQRRQDLDEMQHYVRNQRKAYGLSGYNSTWHFKGMQHYSYSVGQNHRYRK
jgi:hypothetical protein